VVPIQLLVASVIGWFQSGQHNIIIEYLREENRVLTAQLRSQRVRLSDDERRRLFLAYASVVGSWRTLPRL